MFCLLAFPVFVSRCENLALFSGYLSTVYTVLRDETSEADKNAEAVLNELKSIDRCFVNDDADGILAILKNAEANTELSNWDKLRILNECQSALLDLRINPDVIDKIHSSKIFTRLQ